jgi:cytochrome c-type biogenesis protein CcmH
MTLRALLLAACLALPLASPAAAVLPDEVLSDPALEARARDLSRNLRCLVCRNESIDDSNADLARDLRLLLRERLVAGDTDEEAIAFIVDRYGEYVLLNPTRTGSNLILWIAGPAMLILGLGVVALAFGRRQTMPPGAGNDRLSPQEAARLKELIDE